jgi:hypothetical protein
MKIIRSIQNRIYEIRGERVMLDSDLAILYETETKSLDLAVKRNLKCFPKNFMFQLTRQEYEELRFQIETLEKDSGSLRLQNDASKTMDGQGSLPYVFTGQGVAMLSGILNSNKAINMNIAVMGAFMEVKQMLLQQNDLKEQLKIIKERLGEQDGQLNPVYDAIENLLDKNAAQRKWEDRTRIGFKK